MSGSQDYGPSATIPPMEPSDAAAHNGAVWTPWEAALEYNPTSADTVAVSIVPEKEGLFMFRHVVYAIEGTLPHMQTPVKVVRRYSDFIWLLECLTRIYPFRLLPTLPPKRFAVDGRYLSSDNYFLERRRRGLSRFVNQLIKHPVIRKEKLVQMFLTVDTELSVWRKESSIQIEEEFTNRVISPSFVSGWDQREEDTKWQKIRSGAEVSLDVVAQLCFVVDRIHKRQDAMAQDYMKLSHGFKSLSESASQLYSLDENGSDFGTIKDGILSVSRYSSNAHSLGQDESRSTDADFLEDLKLYREILGSVFELFARYDKFGGNNIDQLEQRIQQTERKIELLTNKPDTRPGEIAKLKAAITRDRKSIDFQTNRDWLIKECMTEELILCQRTQYQIAKSLKSWAGDCTKYSELFKDNWTEMNNDAEHLPTLN